MISYNNFPEELLKDRSRVSRWLEELASEHSCFIDKLHYNFVGNEDILRINKEYLNHDYYTDIITFDYSGGGSISGEIFISSDQVMDQAEDYGGDVKSELLRVIAHGLLHLIGFNDHEKEETERMRREEEKALILHSQKFES